MVGAADVVRGAVLALAAVVLHGVLHTRDADVDAAVRSMVGGKGDALHLDNTELEAAVSGTFREAASLTIFCIRTLGVGSLPERIYICMRSGMLAQANKLRG